MRKVGKGSLGDHLAVVAKHKGKQRRFKGAPPLPDAGAVFFRAFVDLHGARGSNGWGPNPISYTEIEAYMRVTRLGLQRWEIEGIRKVDDAYVTAANVKD